MEYVDESSPVLERSGTLPPVAAPVPRSARADLGLAEILSTRCRHAAETVAVLDLATGEQLTYGALERRALDLARRLARRGAGPETRVGVFLERSTDLIATLVGILSAGGAYVPLEPSWPRARLESLIADAGVELLVTTARLRPRLAPAASGTPTLELGRLDGHGGRFPAPGRRRDARPENAAYVLYTSGSTGAPKGVMVPHRALVWYSRASTAHYALRPDDRVAQLSPVTFDISVGEIFPTLAAGATLVLHGGAAPSIPELCERCRQARVTVLLPPTALWHELARTVAAEPAAVPATLRLVSFGGERVAAERVADWRRAVGGRIRLVNGYGPTETTVEATLHELTRGAKGGGPSGSGDSSTTAEEASLVGRPVDGVEARVLDGALRELAAGEPGELCLASAGMARGYLERAALTASRFVPDPFSKVPGGRLYRTGDRARERSDGRFELFGRLDRQVKIRGFRVEPEEIEATLRRHPAVRDAAVVVEEPAPGERRLAAFVAGEEVSEPSLRRFLERLLPPYMMPAKLLPRTSLPLNDRGKIDRAALADAPSSSAGNGKSHGDPPRGRRERLLAAIWAEVLRLPRVGVHEDFFALGGDSILALRITSRAHQQGLRLAPGDLFTHSSVAALAAACEPAALPRRRRPMAAGDTLPLTPVQRWFFDDARLPDPHHFNQSLLLESRRRLEPAPLAAAVAALVARHDSLRLRFARQARGWRQRLADVARAGRLPVAWIDLSRLDGSRQRRALRATAESVQASLDLGSGPLLRLACFERGDGQRQRLLVAVHHLAVDAVTWGLLVEDLERAYLRLAAGRAAALEPAAVSWAEWTELQARHAASAEARRELDFWLARPRRCHRLPLDRFDRRRTSVTAVRRANTYASVARVSVTLDRRRTEELLRQVPAAYRTRIDEVLLTALAQTLAGFLGSRRVLVDLEGHGREPIVAGVDLARTAGWFTSTFPVALELPPEGEPGAALVSVKETLRAIPRRGVGYGILHYLCPDPEVRRRLRALPAAEVSFNYLGQLDAVTSGSRLFAPSSEPRGREHGRRGRRPYPIEIDGGVIEGRLVVRWQFSRNLHRRSTLVALARDLQKRLEELIAHCLSPRAGGVSPADFPLAGLDSAMLNALVGRGDHVEDVYPLTPMQEGMLLHSLQRPGTAVYFEQSAWTLEGELDRDAFHGAWQRLVERHAVLRTSFAWRDLTRPLQIVRRRGELPWVERDWRRLDSRTRRSRLESFLRADRERGFDPSRAPLARVALLRLGERRHRLVWSYHHALLDGWSLARLFDELFELYGALALGAEPETRPARPFRDYVAWLEELDPAPSERFWRGRLAGFTTPTRLALPAPAPASTAAGERRRRQLERGLGVAVTTAIERFARARRLTLNTLVEGAWALLLARRDGRDEVLFGVTVAARPAELARAETTVGLLINTLPVRVRIDESESVIDWLARLQAESVARRAHQYLPLAALERWSGVAAGTPLFDTLLVVESYPTETPLEAAQRRGTLAVSEFEGASETSYPFTLAALPGAELTLTASFDGDRFATPAVTRLLAELGDLLTALADRAKAPVGALLPPRADRRRPSRGTNAIRPPAATVPTAGNGSPQSATEKALAAVWREVLGRAVVGRDESFFELGGHSLLAARVAMRARRALGLELSYRALFDHPTLRSLATAVDDVRRGRAAPAPIEPPAEDGPAPLSFAQRRLWFLEQLEPGDPAYHSPDAWRLRGALEVAALAAALAAIGRRHRVLESRITVAAERPRQETSPGARLGLAVVDLHRLPPARRRGESLRLARAEARRPFDLARAPARATLLRLEAREHLFLRTLHHLVTDAWSDAIFYRELAVGYRAALAGEPLGLPEPPLQYADYARWQRRTLHSAARRRLRAYWRRQLAGLEELSLPTDRPRQAQALGPHRPRRLRGTLPAALVRRLRAHSEAAGASLFMTLLAAWMALLGRFASQRDVAVGVPVAGRDRPELEGLIGLFVNLVVMRGDVGGGGDFRRLIELVRSSALDAYGHQELPFDLLVEDLNPERRAGRYPLVGVIFELVSEPTTTLELPGLEARELGLGGSSGSWELSLTLRPVAGRKDDLLEAELEVDARLFDATTAERLWRRFVHLTASLAARPAEPLGRAAMLARGEAHQLRCELSSTSAPPDAPKDWSELFARQVGRRPQAVAVSDPARGVVASYGGLARRAAAAGAALTGLGVGTETRVGVLAERSLALVEGILGTLAAGAAYVPLDPSEPRARLRRIAAAAGLAAVVDPGGRLDELGLPRVDPRRVSLGATTPVRFSPRQAAYLLHTSGSSGTPQGVLVERRALAWYAAVAAGNYGLGPQDRVLQFAPASFDLSVEEIFATLAAGATLVLRDAACARSAAGFLDACGAWSITVASLPTAFWHELVPAVAATPATLPARLGRLVIGGARAETRALERWRRAASERVRLWNTYGPTEATVVATLEEVGGARRAVGSIGRPIAGARAWVLTADLRPAGLGIAGELCLGGRGLARGLWRDPRRTAVRFVPRPAGGLGGERILRTGDRARILVDGRLEFLGRIDRQLKIRGFRVEPGEIETALGRHPRVDAAFVGARQSKSGNGGSALVAWLATGDTDPALSIEELRAFLAARLPAHMLPAAWVFLPRLPLTASGKIDRRALPEPAAERPDLAAPFAAPEGAIEETLAAVWMPLLGLERVGREDDFFALGGDSLLALRVVARARDAGLHLAPRDFFRRPTIAALARALERRREEAPAAGLAASPGDRWLPLTPIQSWFFSRSRQQPHHFNQSWMLATRRPLDPERLRRALARLAARHDALRLRFARRGECWRQRVEAPEGPPLAVIDLARLPPAAARQALARAAADLQASLDLGRGPTWRAAHFHLGKGEREREGGERLLLVIHHLAVDGVSWGILLEDLEDLYLRPESGTRPSAGASYAAWAELLAGRARGAAVRAELGYWTAVLERRPEPLPRDDPGGREAPAGAILSLILEANETARLLRLPAALDTGVDDLLLTALARAFVVWSGRRRLLVELESHGREEAARNVDPARTVGWFTATYPVLLDLGDEDDNRAESLRRIGACLRAVPDRGLGYGLLRYLSPPDAAIERLRALPPPEVNFNYLGRADAALAGSRLFRPAPEPAGPDEGAPGEREHAFDVNGRVENGRMVFDWSYSPRRYCRSTVEGLARRFYRELLAFLENVPGVAEEAP